MATPPLLEALEIRINYEQIQGLFFRSSSFFVGVAYFREYAIDFYALAFVFGLVFLPPVVIKLPVFNSFYNSSFKSKHR